MREYPKYLLISLFAAFLPGTVTARDPEDSLPIKCPNGWIIVEGTINDSRRVSMMIDTGATSSLLSARLAKELHLITVLESTSVNSIDRVTRCPVVFVPSIRLGTISRPLACPAADLPVREADVIIGRDVLSTNTITVDYEARLLRLGAGAPLSHSVTFDPARKEILVPLRVGNVEIPVRVDSGADALYFFKHKVGSWIKRERVTEDRLVRHLSTVRSATVVSLRNICLGGTKLETRYAIVIESQPRAQSQSIEWHGLLGLSALKARQVRLDLKAGVLSWER